MLSFGITDIGRCRETNQDNFKIYSGNDCFSAVVCDGMGGASGGNIASKLAVNEYTRSLKSEMTKLRRKISISPVDLENAMLAAVDAANTLVYDTAFTDEGYEGMGTTLVAFAKIHNISAVVNVGDSRAYCMRKNTLTQISRDHSFVQYLIDTGNISPDEAQNHPNKNLILRALGVNESIEADTYFLSEYSCILLCTDGLTNFVGEDEITTILRKRKTIGEKAQLLVDAANRQGGADNITALICVPEHSLLTKPRKEDLRNG